MIESRQEYNSGNVLYKVYCKAVDGKTCDGKTLPLYIDLGIQRRGWIALAKQFKEV